MRAHQCPHAFVVEQTPDKRNREGARRFRHRRQKVNVDAGPRNKRNVLLRHGEIGDNGVVVRILHEDGGVGPPQQPSKEEHWRAAARRGPWRYRGERKAQSGQRVYPWSGQSQCGQRTNQRRHKGNMMDEIRIDLPIDAPGFQRGRQKANRVHVAAPPMDADEGEILGAISGRRNHRYASQHALHTRPLVPRVPWAAGVKRNTSPRRPGRGFYAPSDREPVWRYEFAGAVVAHIVPCRGLQRRSDYISHVIRGRQNRPCRAVGAGLGLGTPKEGQIRAFPTSLPAASWAP